MRRFALLLAALGLMLPGTALACHGHSSSVSVTCEQGVKVYRGTPLAASVAPVVVYKKSKASAMKQRMALQNGRLAAQSERIDALEQQLEAANRPQRRRRYNRTYHAPIGAFGRAPYARRRGFRGHRGYRGHRSGIRVSYHR